ncbi:hypothetical protein WUBG_08969 [Wuchereria bancrofti]|uniref:Uncharacterized protein n=1 Tax=Wuchereria bancrofti TaxID=6293 RepID=J9ED76_WUCBA|nr:hypothetical protein WUBG_08969 [Wuchereria bancrofti]
MSSSNEQGESTPRKQPKTNGTHRPTLMTTSSSPSSNQYHHHYDNISSPRISGFFSPKEIRKHF